MSKPVSGKIFLESIYNSVRNLLTALHRKRQKRAKAKQETKRFGVNLWLLFIILLQNRSSCVHLCPDILCHLFAVKIIFLNCFSRVICISSIFLLLKTCFSTSDIMNSRCMYKVIDTESSYLESLILFFLCNSLIFSISNYENEVFSLPHCTLLFTVQIPENQKPKILYYHIFKAMEKQH